MDRPTAPFGQGNVLLALAHEAPAWCADECAFQISSISELRAQQGSDVQQAARLMLDEVVR